MNLLATEQVLWTVPVPSWARKLVREYKKLGDKTDEGQAAKRREAILKELPPLTVYRLTFSSVTISEETNRDKLLKGVRAWFDETYGITPGQFNQWFVDKMRNQKSEIEYAKGNAMDREEINNVFALIQDIADWATIMVCLRKVEHKEESLVDGDGTWKDDGIPAKWREFYGFMEMFPRELMTACAEICNDLNPNVWRTAMDDDSKNFGGVSGSR